MLEEVADLVIGEWGVELAQIREAVTHMEVDFSTEGVSQLTITLADPGLRMLRANYFEVQMMVAYYGTLWEIAAFELSGQEGSEIITLECRIKKLQDLKRDKGPQNFGSMSPTEFAAMKAAQVGLNFVGEPSVRRKNGIMQAGNELTDESAWDVLTRLAGELDYMCFESDGTLFFCSQLFLLDKFAGGTQLFGDSAARGHFIVTYPTTWLDNVVLLEVPRFRKSFDDAHNGATGSLVVHRGQGTTLRPGHSIYMNGIGRFDGMYLVTNVSWAVGAHEPVNVELKTPVPPNPAPDG